MVGNQGFTGLQFLDAGYSLVAGEGGSLSPTNAADGTLAAVRVNADVTAQIDAPLVGSGGINKLDAGTLLLTGANTYTGGTTVSGGTLAGTTSSLQGRILNNARLLFVQNRNGRFNGVLSGTGSLVKQGSGLLLLTGDQPFSGTVAVEQGELQVGDRSTPSVFAGQVTVANGAALSGNGSVGSLDNHGLTQSGGAAGTLSVAGNLSNAADGVLDLTVTSPTGTVLAVGGTATLGGGLQVRSLAPYTGNTTYSLITAGGRVNGTFSSTRLPSLAFLDTSLVYGPNQVGLAVSRNQTTFAEVAATPTSGVSPGPWRATPAPKARALTCSTIRSSTWIVPRPARRSTACRARSTPVPPARCSRTRAMCAMPSTTACASPAAVPRRMSCGAPWRLGRTV